MTAQQLQERLADVPQATLYRHLKKLTETGVLIVVEEIPNRGTLEKVYMLPEKGAEISAEELQQASPDDHLAYFINYLASMIGEFGRYIHQPDADLVKDGVSYRQFSVYLSDEENIEMLMAIRAIIAKAMQNEPDGKRKRRLISVVDFPES
jgi:DNA-binding PadR family transcriptional regulator